MAGKEYTTAPILVNADGHPIPQYLDITDTTDSPQGTFKPLTQLQAEHPDVQNVQLTGSNVEHVIFSKDNPEEPRSADDYEPRSTSSVNHYIPHITSFSETEKIIGVFEQNITIINNLDASLRVQLAIAYYRPNGDTNISFVGNNSLYIADVSISGNGFVAFSPEKGVSVNDEPDKKVIEVPELRQPYQMFKARLTPESEPTEGDIRILSTRRY